MTSTAHPAAKGPPTGAQTGKTRQSPAQQAMRKLGLLRPVDLALHLPLRYEDATRITCLRDARVGDVVQIEATVTHSEVTFRARRQWVVTVDDGTGICQLRFFTFYPSQQKTMAVGARLRLRGEIRDGFGGLQMLHPHVQPAGGPLPESLTPVYPAAAQLPQAYLRRAIENALHLADLSECIPDGLAPPPCLQGMRWWPLQQALQFLHHPTPEVAPRALEDRSHPAWQRLKAEELLAQQVSQNMARRERAALRAPIVAAAENMQSPESLHAQLRNTLPFTLTAAQQRVGAEIARDLARPTPMHRLLQGDVGAGKTVVAALAATLCVDAGWQCALMAPTEILAEQHFRKLGDWLEPLLGPRGLRVAWLVGGQKKKEREAMLAHIARGEAALVVGTHAVIQEHVQFARLALVIIDEQHRFGVAQRLALRDKHASGRTAAQQPHMLMMSATPIPRTLAMSYYADLDVSTIDELPPGRTPVITRVLGENRRAEVIRRIAGQLAQGRQVYWVCPLIEESEVLDLRNATATYEELCAALPHVRAGLLHSRMAAAEKRDVMAAFSAAQIGLLVSTTVIEVGVDVPNASLMVVEHAERFGLSQLHQLRGRVGRGNAASACVLLYAAGEGGHVSQTARERLRAMVDSSDGFEIARRDLEIRGPGEFMGARQSGAAMLRFAHLAEDAALLEWARKTAPRLLQTHPQHAQRLVQRWLGDKAQYLMA